MEARKRGGLARSVGLALYCSYKGQEKMRRSIWPVFVTD